MNREEKSATIQEIAVQIEGSEAIFAVDYRGISVHQAAELRSKLREADASFRVVKNRLTKLAADKAGEERLAELLKGPTALAFVRGDTAQAAKAISTFNKEHDVLTYKGGFMGEMVLDADGFKAIARLPTREVLIGQFAGIVASPITGIVRGLNALIQGLATQLGQIAEQGLVTGEAPEASAAGPVAESDDSSSQAAGESPDSTPPADGEQEEPASEGESGEDQPEAEEPKAEEPSEGAEDVPAEEEEPKAEAETSSDESADDESSEDETSEQDSNEEEG